MLGIYAVNSGVLCDSVSDSAESSAILDLPLNKDALYKDAFTMEHWLSPSKYINGKRILSKLRVGCYRNGST